jgi:hypothetical protein
LRVSRNCACSLEMEMGLKWRPSPARQFYDCSRSPDRRSSKDSLTFAGSLIVPGGSNTPPGFAPLAKNFAPYSSHAMAIPIAFSGHGNGAVTD